MKQKILASLLIFISFFSKAQSVKIDSIPFSTKSSLLVFKGLINGSETDFVLDTGASFGVITTSKANSTNTKTTRNKNVTDSNDVDSKMQGGMIESMFIGSFEIKNVKSVVYDMPLLACNNYYLLGANAINKLNWRIDFEKNVLYVSESIFEHSSEMLAMPISYKNNRHFTNFTINKTEFKNCLIDLGYNGFFEVSDKDPLFKKLMQENKDRIVMLPKLNMSLTKIKISNYYAFSFDNLMIDTKRFDHLKIEIRENIDNKIGLKFFSQLATVLIMNNTDSKYYLKPSNKSVSLQMNFDAECLLKDGKLIIACKNDTPESSAKDLEPDEEIKSINGLKAEDFKDDCVFLLWKIENTKNDECIIEKLNGQKITLKKQFLKS